MRIAFVIEGEGRGHSTQAIAIKELLEKRGHTLCKVLVGSNGTRPMNMFRESFGDIVEFESLNLIYTKKSGVSVSKTLWNTVRNIPKYIDSLDVIDRELKDSNPDIVINFFEPLYSLYLWKQRNAGSRVKNYVIGHQFMFNHPVYPTRWKRFYLQRKVINLCTTLVGYGSKKLALSFYPAPNHKDINVVPPILRKKLFEVDAIKNVGDYMLCYVINSAYVDDIKESLKVNPMKAKIFCENADKMTTDGLDIEFNNLNADLFMEEMAGSKYVVCTAGFESTAEARYLGKQLLMVPVPNHCEQFYNAIDASKQKIGIYQHRFTFNKLLKSRVSDNTEFRKWIDQYEEIFVRELGL